MTDDTSIAIVLRIDAPPEKVYAAWIELRLIEQWWGPDSGPVLSSETDVRVGGRFAVAFRTEDGKEHRASGVYREVVPNRRLVFSWVWDRAPDEESEVTIDFEPDGQGTRMTFTHARLPSKDEAEGHCEGWNGAFAKLNAFFEINTAAAKDQLNQGERQ